MAQNYTRQSSLADGDTITAALFNNEYNQLVNAFTYSSSSESTTGHKHDGSTGQGGNVHTIGDLDFLNKIVADSTNNRWGFFVEVSSAAVEQVRIQDGAIVPVTDSDIDLGTSSLEFKDLFLDGTAHVDTLDVDVNATVAGTLGVTGALTGSSTLQGTTITATTAFVPDASDGAALGTSSLEFSDLFLADGAVINFGADQDVSLTHVADTGLLLSSTDQLQFGDSGTYIYQSADGVLDLVSDTEIEINATTIDMNGALDLSGNATVGGTLAVTGAATLSSTLQATTITATTAFVPDASDGAALGTTALEFSDLFLADGAVISFGDDQDVSITHVADTGLLISSTDQLQFGDSGTYIYQSADGVLDLVSDTEIEINATTIDINGAADVSGNLAVGGNLTVTGAATIAGNLTFGDAATDTVAFSADVASNLLPSADNTYDLGASGSEWKDLYVDGTANLDVVDIDGAVDMASTLTLAGNADFNGDLDVDGTANLDVVDIDGATQADGTITVGVDGTGYDVKFFGDTSGAYMLWDESADDLKLVGAAGLTVAGDVDVDGTTNLDIVDIDGAVDFASTTAHAVKA